MPSAWDTALKSRSRRVRAKIRTTIAKCEESGAFGNFTIRNLLHDRFLSNSAANDFVDLFISFSNASDFSSLKSAFIQLCRSHALCGGEIGLKPYPKRIGRAIDKSRFINILVTANAITRSRAERLMQDLEKGTLTGTRRILLASLYMSEFGVWISWDRESNGEDPPFAFLRSKDAYELRNALGLPIDRAVLRRQPLLTFEYSGRAAGMLYRPTTADAADFLRFSVRQPPPPPESDWYGLTVPWQDDPHDKLQASKGLYPPKRPEALHGKIKFPQPITCETLYTKP